MIDLSGFGTGITIVSTGTFPQGFTLKQFSDDEEPLSIENTEVAGYEKLYDGSIFTFDKTSPLLLSVGIMPNTDDDMNMKILLQMRKSSKQILPLPDTTSMIIGYPDGGKVAMSNGTMLSGPLADSLSAQGRKKGNVYHFVFGTFAGAQSAKELVATVAQNIASIL